MIIFFSPLGRFLGFSGPVKTWNSWNKLQWIGFSCIVTSELYRLMNLHWVVAVAQCELLLLEWILNWRFTFSDVPLWHWAIVYRQINVIKINSKSETLSWISGIAGASSPFSVMTRWLVVAGNGDDGQFRWMMNNSVEWWGNGRKCWSRNSRLHLFASISEQEQTIIQMGMSWIDAGTVSSNRDRHVEECKHMMTALYLFCKRNIWLENKDTKSAIGCPANNHSERQTQEATIKVVTRREQEAKGKDKRHYCKRYLKWQQVIL